MADVRGSVAGPARITYGRKRQISPLSDDDDGAVAPSSPAPLLFDSSPAAQRRERRSTDGEADTGNTSAMSSDDATATIGRAKTRPQGKSTLTRGSDLSDDDESDAAGDPVARMRARMGLTSAAHLRSSQASGSNGSSSLSSAPPLSQNYASDVSSASEADSDELPSLATRRGAVAGRMKKRENTNSTNSRDAIGSRRNLSRSQSPASSSSGDTSARKEREAAAERKTKLAAMAAKRKVVEEVSLEDEFFGQAQRGGSRSNSNSQGDDPIHSGSNADDGSEDDTGVSQRLERSIQSLKPRRSRPRTSKPSKVKGPKSLSKKELEEMHKTSARIERSKHIPNLNSQTNPVNRLQYDIGTLAAKFALPGQKQVPSSDIAPVTDDLTASSDPIEAETPRVEPANKRHERDVTAISSSPGILKSRSVVNRPSTLGGTDDDDDIDKTWSVHDFMAAKKARERQEALNLKKRKWLLAMQSEAQKSDIMTGSSENNVYDDDDIEIIPSADPILRTTTEQPKVAMRLFQTDLAARQQQPQIQVAKGKQPSRARRSGPPSSRQLDLKQSLLHKIKQQNIKARAVREHGEHAKAASSLAVAVHTNADDSIDALKMIQERAQQQGQREDGGSGDEEGEKYDSDFVPEGDEQGSGSEVEDVTSQREASDASDDEFGLDQAPPSSQTTHRSSGSVTRVASPELDSDEDDEADSTLRVSRKSRARAAVRDEEDDENDGISPVTSSARRLSSRSDGESIDIDDFARPSKSAASDAVSTRSSAGLGAPVGLTQFFTETQIENDGEDDAAIPESQQESLREDVAPSRSFPAPSDDSVLGQFFADTQVSAPARGESLDVIGATGRAKNAEIAPFINESAGLSQFFEEGTQDASAAAPAARKASQLMGPPATIPQDGFAALRRAAQAEENLALSPDSLPSIDGDDVDDMDALPDAIETPRSVQKTPKQYLNRDGFFTQTRPDMGSQWSMSQSESQDILDQRRDSHASELDQSQLGAEPESPVVRRKRFTRAVRPDAQSEDDDSELDASVHESEAEDIAGSGNEAEGGDPTQPRNAWNVLREGASKANKPDEPAGKRKKQREYRFLEGEAVESDEEAGGKAGRKGAGGLDGIWSDSGSENEDEEDDEEDDGRDLDGLVDNEREKDEEMKDLLARERYQQDLDADEAAALALADKAARGELRKKRRGRDGLEDLLDDDFDEERMMRRINNPRALMAKRRRVEGDEMDLLAAKAESQAFVQGYTETHQADSCDQYGFLATVDDSDADSQGGEDEREDEDASSADEADLEDDEVPVQRITRKQLAKELRDKRQRRKQGIVSDDEDGGAVGKYPEAQRTIDPFASDESGDEGLPSFVRDRTAVRRSGVAQAQKSNGSGNTAPVIAEDDDDDYDDASTALIGRLSRQKRATSPGTAKRLAQLADEFKSEPDFLAGRQQTYASKGMGGASITSFGSAASRGKDRQKAGAGAFESTRRSGGAGQVKKAVSAPVGGGAILSARRVEESQ